MQSARGTSYIVGAILIWSSLPVVIRLSNVPVHELIFYSVLVSTIILSFAMPLKRYRALVPRGRRFLYLLFLGPILLANTFAFFYAYKHTTISNAILTHYIAPVLVALMAPMFLKEVITKRVVLSILIATIGLFVLLGMEPGEFLTGLKEPGSNAMGIASGLFSGAVYAVLILVVRAFSLNIHPVPMCYFQNLMILLILFPFVGKPPVDALWSFLLMGVAHSTIAPILYFKGMHFVTANRAAILGYIEPVGAIIFGMMFIGEYPRAVSIIGGVLILYSGYLALSRNSSITDGA
jgi:drug/metabolite transporter (DMT)-like permease